jgi:hypothetical protein
MTWLTIIEYLCHKSSRICSTYRKHFMAFPHSWLITEFVTRWPRRVSLVGQELPTFPGHLSSPPVYRGVRVTRSFVLYVCFVYRCLSFRTFSFGHCVVWSSSIYGFWLPIWYLQNLQTLQWPKEKVRKDLQHITQKTKDWPTGIPLKPGICRFPGHFVFVCR